MKTAWVYGEGWVYEEAQQKLPVQPEHSSSGGGQAPVVGGGQAPVVGGGQAQ